MKKRIIILTIGIIALFTSLSLIIYYLPLWEALSQRGIHNVSVNEIDKNVNLEPIKQGGKSFLYKDELYFINDYNDSKIYKLELSNKRYSELSLESTESFSICDDWIYYIKKTGGLYRMKTDGSNNSKLADKAVRNLVVTHDWVYFLLVKEIKKNSNTENINDLMDTAYGTYIYRVRKDGSMLSDIGDVCSYKFVVDDNKVYYIESTPKGMPDFFPSSAQINVNNDIYMINIDGTEKHNLGIKTSSALDVKDNWLYYSNHIDKGIYKSRFINQKTETYKISSRSTGQIKISGDTLFFTQEKRINGLWRYRVSSQLYKINTNGENFSRLSKYDEIDSIDIFDKYIFCHTIEFSPAIIEKITVITDDGTEKQVLVASVL